MPTVRKDELTKEIWKSPPSLNKWWVEVSNFGRVRTLPHTISFVRLGKTEERLEPGCTRKCTHDSRGRLQIFLSQGVGFLVHRLVAECFVENPNPARYNYVFFKNGNISDCRANNLQWGDRQDKGYLMRGKYAHNLITIYDNGIKAGEFRGLGEAARALGCTKQAVDIAVKTNRPCRGFGVKSVPLGGEKIKQRDIADGRKSSTREFGFIKMPDAIFED